MTWTTITAALLSVVMMGLMGCSHSPPPANEQVAAEPEILIVITNRGALLNDGVTTGEFAQAVSQMLERQERPLSPQAVSKMTVTVREHTYLLGDIAAVKWSESGSGP